MKIRRDGTYRKYVKRPMDLILASIAIIILSPLFLMIAILVKAKLGSPVFFKQKRPGLHEEVFLMYKFRTMTEEKDEKGNLLPDHVRLTRFGRLLRSTSLDELPELFNIVKGDMSIVGPRPLLVQYLPLYNQHQKRRHEVRPGLSGLAQINGRNVISWEDKFQLDVKYTENISFLGDWKIILLTINKILIKEGIHQEEQATVQYFTGDSEDV
ncbi:sugar transferase [Oceanobacillus sojae]|uniref:sugar transferase n=1 Tax=Oceanobacillus sojae TaxID=582851 RepID=UPI0009882F0B|nr:sugar transferase [Oceanobacillus sojae]